MSLSARGGGLINDGVDGNEDSLCVLLALADVEDDSDDDADEGEGAQDTSDNGTCRWAGSDLSLLF